MPQLKLKPKGIKVKALKKELVKDCPILVLYYMNGCGHCESLEPIWNNAIGDIKASDGIKIAAVESSEMKELPDNLSYNVIAGFPTIVVISKGKLIAEYRGPRYEANISAFAKEYMKPKSVQPVAKPKKPTVKKNKSV